MMGSVDKSRNTKSRKAYPKVPRRVSEMSKEVLEATLRKKSECNTKALQIVERLLDNTVSEDWFLDSLKFINESHYQDIIEERVISLNCGYPMCKKELKNIPNQQYHISTKLNKVYDITERKNFCSNQCYRASTYLKQQLLTSPLWLRDKEEIPKFVLLPVNSSSGSVGEEVDIGQSNPLKEELKQVHKHKQEKPEDFTSISQFMRNSLSILASDVDDVEKNEKRMKNTGKKKENKRKECSDLSKKSSDFQNKEPRVVTEENTTQKELNECRNVCASDSTPNSESSSIANDPQYVQNSNEPKINLKNDQFQHLNNDDDNHSTETGCSEEINKTITELSQRLDETLVLDVCNTDLDITKSDSGENLKANVISRKTNPIEGGSEHRKQKKKSKKNKDSTKKSLDIPPMTSVVIHIEKCLHEWFTIDSMCFLFGEEKMKEIVSEKGECIKEYYKAVHKSSWDPKLQEQYIAICKRLNIMELEENQIDDDTSVAMKPLPDYTAVKEEGKKMDLKVKAFFQGKTAYEDKNESIPNTNNEEVAPVLPLVDLHAQNALRRRIVLDRLNRVLPDLLRTFGLSSRDVSEDVRNLVATFKLSSHNITFKPPEWSLLGLIVIKLLAIKDTRLQILLDSEEVAKYTIMMLMGFQQDGGYLDRLIVWLTDLDNLLYKQQTN